MSVGEETLEEEDAGPVLKRRRPPQDTELDMTPMIDCTFLLLIFFTVAATLDNPADVELPPAQFGVGIDPDKAVIITIKRVNDEGLGEIYLRDGATGSPLTGDAAEQAAAIVEYVSNGMTTQGKTGVLIKAGVGVLHREVARVSAAAANAAEQVPLHAAVLESK